MLKSCKDNRGSKRTVLPGQTIAVLSSLSSYHVLSVQFTCFICQAKASSQLYAHNNV